MVPCRLGTLTLLVFASKTEEEVAARGSLGPEVAGLWAGWMETTASAGAFATVLNLSIKTQNIPPLSVLALPSFSLEGRAD